MLTKSRFLFRSAAISLAYNLITQSPFSPLQQMYFVREQQTCSSPYWVAANQLAPHHLQNHPPETPLWVPNSFVFQRSYNAVPLSNANTLSGRRLTTTLQWAEVEPFYKLNRLKEGFSVIPLVNACFVEETDLFFFLLQTSLTVQQLETSRPATVRLATEASEHVVFLNGFFEKITAAHHYNAWCSLVDAVPKINHQISLGAQFSPVESHDGVCSPQEKCCEEQRDYFVHLMAPPAFAGAQRPQLTCDTVWLDGRSVCKHQLSLYQDAFWIPFVVGRNTFGVGTASDKSGGSSSKRIASSLYETRMPPYGASYFNTDQLLYNSALRRLLKVARAT